MLYYSAPSVTASTCGGGLRLEQPAANENPTEAVARLSEATQKYIRECACDTPNCIADALDQYSEALAVVAPRLPTRLRSLPRIVAEAARQVRVAKTKAEAVAALDHAVAIIHKDIILVSSEDVETGRPDRRSGDLVADTLRFASSELVNSGGL